MVACLSHPCFLHFCTCANNAFDSRNIAPMDKASVRRAKIGWYRRLSSTGCTSLVLVLVLRATLNLNCISRDTSDIHQQAILDIEMQYLMGQTKELVDEEQIPEKDWKASWSQ